MFYLKYTSLTKICARKVFQWNATIRLSPICTGPTPSLRKEGVSVWKCNAASCGRSPGMRVRWVARLVAGSLEISLVIHWLARQCLREHRLWISRIRRLFSVQCGYTCLFQLICKRIGLIFPELLYIKWTDRFINEHIANSGRSWNPYWSHPLLCTTAQLVNFLIAITAVVILEQWFIICKTRSETKEKPANFLKLCELGEVYDFAMWQGKAFRVIDRQTVM